MAAKKAVVDLFTKAMRNSSVREIRVHFDPAESGNLANAALRTYVLDNYHLAKAANPDLPILVREATDVTPKVYVRYDKGVERSQVITPKDASSISTIFDKLLM